MAEQVKYHRGSQIGNKTFQERVKRATALMKDAGLNAVLLTKPQNTMYFILTH